MSKRGSLSLAVSLVVVLTLLQLPLTACGAGQSGSSSSTVTIAQGVDVTTLDAGMDTITASNNVIDQMFDPLVRYSDDFKFEPALATSWEQLDDKTWKFNLRKDVKFHDGSALTSADVKYSFERILDPALKSKQADYVASVDHVDAPDPNTAIIKLKEPNAAFLARVTMVYVVPKAYVEKVGPQAFATKPIGTGAYKFVEWVKDDHVSMAANPQYYLGEPKIKNVVFKPIPEASTRISALRAGTVDLITNFPPDQIPAVEKDSKVRIETIDSVRTAFITLNTRQKPLNDVRVRLALNYGVNTDDIIKNLFKGMVKRENGPFSPYVFGYNKDIKPFPYDPQKAKQLLAEAGYPNGLELKLETPIGRTLLDKEASEALATEWAKIGVKVTVDAKAFDIYWADFLGKKMQNMAYVSLGSTIPDLDYGLGLHWDGKRRGLYYSTPEMDKLIDDGRWTSDQTKRAQIYQQVTTKLQSEDVPQVWLWTFKDIYGVSNRLNWKPRPDEHTSMFSASLK